MSLPVPTRPGPPPPDRQRERPTTVIRPPARAALDLPGHLRGLGQYGELFLTLSAHRIKVRYKQSLLGVSWAILHPVSLMLIYTFIFSFVVRMPSDGLPYSLFAYSAVLPWTYFAMVLSTSTNALVTSAHLVTKIYFPREILVLTYAVAGLFDFLVGSVVLAALLMVYGVPLTLYALWAVPIVVVLTAFVAAIGLVLSIVQVRFRDIGVAVPLVLQLWMFLSPVVYPLSAVPERMRTLFSLNPMVGVIENFRRALVLGQPPDPASLAWSAAVAAVVLPLAYLWFKRMEATVADTV
jgi:lipopolysaccharide transport system permease protein